MADTLQTAFAQLLGSSPGSDYNGIPMSNGVSREPSMPNELNEQMKGMCINGNFNGKVVAWSDYQATLNGNGFDHGNTLKPPGHPDNEPYTTHTSLEGSKVLDSIDDKLASQSDLILESTRKMLEQFECNLLEKFGYVPSNVTGNVEKIGKAVGGCHDSVEHGLQDMIKTTERSQARLEAKIEFVTLWECFGLLSSIFVLVSNY